MSEDEARRAGHEEEPDTEAHGRAAANIEPDDEARRSENDEVEAHGRMAGPDDGRSAGRAV